MSTLTFSDLRTPRALGLLALFLAVVIGVGAILGVATAPGEWYAGLQKPPFNPPNWVFGPVWFTLYVLIAVAGWRTFMAGPTSRAMQLWFGQMALNWLWTPVWFSLHTLFAVVHERRIGALRLSVPEWGSLDLAAAAIGVFAVVATFAFHVRLLVLLAACAALGLAWHSFAA